MASQNVAEHSSSDPSEASQQQSHVPVDPHIADDQPSSRQFGRRRLTTWTHLEADTILALFQICCAAIEEKQRAIRTACRANINEHDLVFIFDLLASKQYFVPSCHYPCKWTYLKFKLLRREYSDSYAIDYDLAAKHMNAARENRHFVDKAWWRPGGRYTGNELLLATQHLYWRLPNVNVRASTAWSTEEGQQLLNSFTLCQSLSRITQSMSTPPGQFLPTASNQLVYDRLSLEQYIDVMLKYMPLPELHRRFGLDIMDLTFFAIVGDGRSMAPEFLELWGTI